MVVTDWPAWTQTVTADVQGDDQESCGLQAKSQRLHGWSVAGIGGKTLKADCVLQEQEQPILLRPTSSTLAPCHLQNFDLEKKEENSETDEDGLKAESPELLWQMLLQTRQLCPRTVAPAPGVTWGGNIFRCKKKTKQKNHRRVSFLMPNCVNPFYKCIAEYGRRDV